jgi:SAM-dependent methyltransferase
VSGTLEPVGPNAEQIRYWNEIAGPRWVRQNARLDLMIGELGNAAIDRAAPALGEDVVDVGCGCGSTSIELGRRVGDSGTVLGVDISGPMLEVARQRSGAAHVRFANADAQTHAFPPESADLVFSRFGVMFFADPTAAFRNLGGALRPRGRLAFLCWQVLAKNPWMTVPLGALASVVALPPPPPADAPGPFSFASSERVTDILANAGFTAIAFEPLAQQIWIGGKGATLDESAEFALQLGPAGAAFRDAPPEQQGCIADTVRDALAPYSTGAGVPMDALAWIVTARRG